MRRVFLRVASPSRLSCTGTLYQCRDVASSTAAKTSAFLDLYTKSVLDLDNKIALDGLVRGAEAFHRLWTLKLVTIGTNLFANGLFQSQRTFPSWR